MTHDSLGPQLAVAAILCSLTSICATARAQETAASSREQPVDAGKSFAEPEETAVDLVFVIRGGLDERPRLLQLREVFGIALKATPECTCDRVQAHALDPGVFEALSRLLAPSASGTVRAADPVTIEPIPERPRCWVIRLSHPLSSIESLELRYVNDGEERIDSFDLRGDAEQSGTLRPLGPGDYILRSERELRGAEYRMMLRDATARRFVGWKRWPRVSRSYLVKLTGFRGDETKLLESLYDEYKVPVPLKVGPDRIIRFVLRSAPPPQPRPFDGDHFTVFLSSLRAKTVSRIWMLFPLSSEQRETILERLADARLTPQELAKWIRSGSDGYRPILACGQAVLRPEDEPRWYEIFPERSKEPDGRTVGFRRVFRLEDIKTWKNHPTAQRAWRILVYEFESSDGTPIAIRISRAQQEHALWLDEEVRAWPEGLSEMPSD